MASTNLGKVTMTPKGEYAPEATYNRLDLVRFQGSSFVVLKDGVVGVTPSDDGQQYSLLAQKGDSGEQGAVGEMGPQGEQGLQGESGAQGVPGEKGDKGDRGEKGEKGESGFSPTVQTMPTEGGTTITITDHEGAKSFTVKDGAKGDKGERGETGAQGVQGEQGVRGEVGPQGEAGPVGPQGVKGEKGETGEKGEPGKGFRILGKYDSLEALKEAVTHPEAGDAYSVGSSVPCDIYIYDSVSSDWVNNGKLQGAKGEKGDPGQAGAKGERGEPGAPGQNGAPGKDGAPGAKGESGFSPTVQTIPTEGGTTITITDHEGAKSFTVKDGAKGDKGEPGAPGQDGAPGKDGTPGEKGEKGEPGKDGTPGEKGEKGDPGKDGAPGEKGETGAQGPAGAKGDAGQSASLRIGTVQTGQAGTQAQVTNSGTALDAVFDFVIPCGEKGDRGEPGAKGDRGDTGVQGSSGPQGARGEPGKTAYQSAQSGGFSGSESTFNSNLAQVGNKIDRPSSAQNGQVLVYRNGAWVAENVSGGDNEAAIRGSYSGSGGSEQKMIALGFRPKAVIISPSESYGENQNYFGYRVDTAPSSNASTPAGNMPIIIYKNGFYVRNVGSHVLNGSTTYYYMALK